MGRGGSRKIDFSAYRKAVIDVAKYHKGQALNKKEMNEFWGLVVRAYQHHTGLHHVFKTKKFNHNARAIPLLKKRNMLTVERLSSAYNYVIYSFSGDTHE